MFHVDFNFNLLCYVIVMFYFCFLLQAFDKNFKSSFFALNILFIYFMLLSVWCLVFIFYIISFDIEICLMFMFVFLCKIKHSKFKMKNQIQCLHSFHSIPFSLLLVISVNNICWSRSIYSCSSLFVFFSIILNIPFHFFFRLFLFIFLLFTSFCFISFI